MLIGVLSSYVNRSFLAPMLIGVFSSYLTRSCLTLFLGFVIIHFFINVAQE